MKKILLYLFSILVFTNTKSQIPGELWGMTSGGGSANFGTIFKTDINGSNFLVQENFGTKYGTLPDYSQFLVTTNGKMYGLTSSGGKYNFGILFEYDPVSTSYVKKHDFNGSLNGATPMGSLIQASNGKLYGMTSSGGANNLGVLFEYDLITNIYSKKIDFNGAINGAQPKGSLIETLNGKLYGMTYAGGANNMGTVFEFNISNSTYTKLIDFNGSINGSYPYGDLLKVTNNKLYGMTFLGGINNKGVIFELDYSSFLFTKKMDFSGAITGANPAGKLIVANNNKLYGLTSLGGTSNSGVLFEFDQLNSTFTKKFDFNTLSCGSNPFGNLLQANNGKLYGLTQTGGLSTTGVLFEYDLTTSLVTGLTNLQSGIGCSPLGSLIQHPNGFLYGMTKYGGASNAGVILKFDIANQLFTNEIDFGLSFTNLNGSHPAGSLVKYNDKFYGLTFDGGQNNLGVIFEYDPNTSLYTKKFEFSGLTSGRNPYGGLTIANNGKLYGLTSQGGVNDAGVLFEFDPLTSNYTKKYDFNSANGILLYGDLLLATNGKLYGLTVAGGLYNNGVIFEYDVTTNSYSVKHNFTGPGGCMAKGSLIQASNGKLYGVTSSCGIGFGIIFEYDITNSMFTKKHDFTGIPNTNSPYSALKEGPNGKLYGLGNGGAISSLGDLFEYDILTSTYQKKIDFNGTGNGNSPWGSMINSSNGKMYGMTMQGGTNGNGTIFEYDPITSILTKKTDLTLAGGSQPVYGHLIEVCQTITINIQPTGTITCSGNSFNLTTNATGTNISYQWFLNNLSIANATNSTYAISNSNPSNFGIYYCQISNGCSTVLTNTVSVNLPNVNIISSSNLICSGQSVTLTANGAINYTWSTNSTSQSIAISPSTTTTYSLTGTDINGCANTIAFTQSVSLCTPILSEQNKLTEINIFPNPFENSITIINYNGIQGQVYIYDSMGSVIFKTAINKERTDIDLNDKKAGLYILRIGLLTRKIIKK